MKTILAPKYRLIGGNCTTRSDPQTAGHVFERRDDQPRFRRPPLAELHLLRSIGCLGVVAIHAMTVALGYPGPAWTIIGLSATQMLLMFSTPAFIILSAILVGYSYEHPPAGFLEKRLRNIMVPFITMNIVFAAFLALIQLRKHGDVDLFWTHFLNDSGRFLAGESHLWFILPMFQFYLLYALLGNKLCQFSPKVVLTGAFTLNIGYLAFFNFIPLPEISGFAPFRWSLLFPAWIFYFALGFYSGKSYAAFQKTLQTMIRKILAALGFSGALVVCFHFSGILNDVSPRRVDVLFYTLCVTAVVLYVGSRLRSPPRILLRVSQLSFGIYILHPFFLEIMWRGLPHLARLSPPGAFVVLWFGATAAAFLATDLISRIRIGTIFVGRMRPLPPLLEKQ